MSDFYVFLYADFDKAVSLLEKKLEGRNATSFDGLVAGGRRALNRQSSQFHIAPKDSDEGVMIDPSMLQTTHSGRKASIMKPAMKPGTSGKRRQNSIISLGSGSGANSVSGGGGGTASHAKESNVPTGAHVPAAFYREIEEQLADALFKRTQAKLMADPDQANVESALVDGLKVFVTAVFLVCYSCLP